MSFRAREGGEGEGEEAGGGAGEEDQEEATEEAPEGEVREVLPLLEVIRI